LFGERIFVGLKVLVGTLRMDSAVLRLVFIQLVVKRQRLHGAVFWGQRWT
jgi:hypothetical protein